MAPRSGYLCPGTAALLRKTYFLGIPPRLSRRDCDRAADALAAALREAAAAERAGPGGEASSPASRPSPCRAPSEGSQSAAVSLRSAGGPGGAPFGGTGLRTHGSTPEDPFVAPQVP